MSLESNLKNKSKQETYFDIGNFGMSLVHRFVIVQFNGNVMLCSVTCHIVYVYVHQYFTIRDLDFQLHLFLGRACVPWFEDRDDCSFCLYRWHFWPSLFKNFLSLLQFYFTRKIIPAHSFELICIIPKHKIIIPITSLSFNFFKCNLKNPINCNPNLMIIDEMGLLYQIYLKTIHWKHHV